jgi:hypothetical protein
MWIKALELPLLVSVHGRLTVENVMAVAAVAVSHQVWRRISISKGLHDLLGGPGRSRMLNDIEMQHLTLEQRSLPTSVFPSPAWPHAFPHQT